MGEERHAGSIRVEHVRLRRTVLTVGSVTWVSGFQKIGVDALQESPCGQTQQKLCFVPAVFASSPVIAASKTLCIGKGGERCRRALRCPGHHSPKAIGKSLAMILVHVVGLLSTGNIKAPAISHACAMRVGISQPAKTAEGLPAMDSKRVSGQDCLRGPLQLEALDSPNRGIRRSNIYR